MKRHFLRSQALRSSAFVVLAALVFASTASVAAQEDIAEAQAQAAAELRKQLPIKVDDVTTLQTVLSMGPVLIYDYILAVDKSELDLDVFKAAMHSQLMANNCEEGALAEAIKIGAEYNFNYRSQDGLRIAEFHFDKDVCGF